ncbi:MAG: DUF4832 domain-containing protein, partial [Brevinematales bacterium]|nr:DUF4832 domain-containing protein [Brevinematales bacterium]
MKNKIIIFTMALFIVSVLSAQNSSGNLTTWPFPDGYKTVELKETPEAFPNPMKGFRPQSVPNYHDLKHHEYESVYKYYIGYNVLEKTSKDSVEKIIDWCNTAWGGIEKRNIKIIPRVVLSFPTSNQPGVPKMDYWPDDIPNPSGLSRWDTKELMDRLAQFIAKLGKAWDNDPRVAAVEVGLWGNWGEHHLFPDANGRRIPASFQKALGDAFASSFHNKKVMVRYPDSFTAYRFGYYWDAFASIYEDGGGGPAIIRRDVWKDQMISGEIAYDVEYTKAEMGSTPNETLMNDKYTDHVISWINRLHASSVGWIDEYNGSDPKLKANAARIQKALGYRFVIRSAAYKQKAANGEEIKIGFEVSNVGSAPFYYDWPVEISLLNQNRNPVYKKKINADIRTWLPGETYKIIDSITIPNDLKNDTYIIAVSILDPAGNQPSLRFANINYYNGGRTPLGIIGVNKEPKYNNFNKFDKLYPDNSLGYEQAPGQSSEPLREG